MSFPQIKSEDGRVELKVGLRRASLLLDGKRVVDFDVRHEETLSTQAAEAMELPDPPPRWLVAFERSSPRARHVLRALGVSYVSTTGEMHIHAPPVHVELPARRPSFSEAAPFRSSPFAIRAGRVPRWLLLHLEATPSFRDLGAEVDLGASVVSRTVRALAEEGFVAVSSDPNDSRVRRVRVRRPPALLEAFERASLGRRVAQKTWDIGSRDPEKTLERLHRSANRIGLPYAIGGLAGASRFAKVVEPASVDVWIRRKDIEAWADDLSAVPARPRPGTVTFRATPDPYVLSLAEERGGLQVADPVQVYLDCRGAGERAIDAADHIRQEMGW